MPPLFTQPSHASPYPIPPLNNHPFLSRLPFFFNIPQPIPYYFSPSNHHPRPSQFGYLLFGGFCVLHGLYPQGVAQDEVPVVRVDINITADTQLIIPTLTNHDFSTPQNHIHNQQNNNNQSTETTTTTTIDANGQPITTTTTTTTTMTTDITTLLGQTDIPKIYEPVYDPKSTHSANSPHFTPQPNLPPFTYPTSQLAPYQPYPCSATISFTITDQERFNEEFHNLLPSVNNPYPNIPISLLVSYDGYPFRIFSIADRPKSIKFYNLTYDLARIYTIDIIQSYSKVAHVNPPQMESTIPLPSTTFCKAPFYRIVLLDPDGNEQSRYTGADLL